MKVPATSYSRETGVLNRFTAKNRSNLIESPKAEVQSSSDEIHVTESEAEILRDPQHIVATGSVDDIIRLYKFDNFGSSSLPSVFVAHSGDVSRLWHERFGHLNFRSLQNLCKEKMVTSLPMVSCKDVVCSGCVLDKHHQDSFEKCASWHTSAPLQLVHSDLCGPLPVVPFSSFKYFLTFIDYYSRCTWVYFLKLKSKVFDMFLASKALVEKQSSQHILKLRSDNGGEYVNNKFITFCIE